MRQDPLCSHGGCRAAGGRVSTRRGVGCGVRYQSSQVKSSRPSGFGLIHYKGRADFFLLTS